MQRTFTAAALIAISLTAAGAGCMYDPELPAPAPPTPDESEMMLGFSFVVTDTLAGMPAPGIRAPLEQDLGFLADQGIELLVSLTEAGVDPAAAARHGIAVLHVPVRDFTAPGLDQLTEVTAAVHTAIDAGRAVGVHCGAGLGRTGTFLAAYFVTEGLTSDAAIARVRGLRPGSVETADQERAVREFAIEQRRRDATPAL